MWIWLSSTLVPHYILSVVPGWETTRLFESQLFTQAHHTAWWRTRWGPTVMLRRFYLRYATFTKKREWFKCFGLFPSGGRNSSVLLHSLFFCKFLSSSRLQTWWMVKVKMCTDSLLQPLVQSAHLENPSTLGSHRMKKLLWQRFCMKCELVIVFFLS